jgi:PAB-dependent poly(A)-specific ribonuclease subunit 3
MFGRLVFTLYCNNLAAMNTLPKALDMIGRQYSVVKTLALYLISKPGPHNIGLSHYRYSLHLIVSQNITQVIDMIGANRLLHEMDDMHR